MKIGNTVLVRVSLSKVSSGTIVKIVGDACRVLIKGQHSQVVTIRKDFILLVGGEVI